MFEEYIPDIYDILITIPTDKLYEWDIGVRTILTNKIRDYQRHSDINVVFVMNRTNYGKDKLVNSHIQFSLFKDSVLGHTTFDVYKEDIRKWKLKNI